MILRRLERRFLSESMENILEELFIVRDDGLKVFHYTFGKEKSDPGTISRLLSAAEAFLEEALTSSEPLRLLDVQDKNVIAERFDRLQVIVICKAKPLEFSQVVQIRKALASLVEEFETLFYDYIEKMDESEELGDLTSFHPARETVFKWLEPILYRKVPSPAIRTMITSQNLYKYTVTDEGLNAYERFYSKSKSFHMSLSRLSIPLSTIDEIMKTLNKKSHTLHEISEAFSIDKKTMVKLLHHLAMRDMVITLSSEGLPTSP